MNNVLALSVQAYSWLYAVTVSLCLFYFIRYMFLAFAPEDQVVLSVLNMSHRVLYTRWLPKYPSSVTSPSRVFILYSWYSVCYCGYLDSTIQANP